ncbi:MAG TPA: hypothetical protein VGF28_15925 [Thermoanaerobaculia bacterium]|jgi:hypothetical protein
MRFRLLLALACCLSAHAVAAQIVWEPAIIRPATPRETDRIEADFEIFGGCDTEVATVIFGDVVRTTVTRSGCVIGPPPPIIVERAEFGPLPAGAYTYEIFVTSGGPPVLRSTQPLVVAAVAPTVPALSPRAYAVLALGMIGVALLALKRQ